MRFYVNSYYFFFIELQEQNSQLTANLQAALENFEAEKSKKEVVSRRVRKALFIFSTYH